MNIALPAMRFLSSGPQARLSAEYFDVATAMSGSEALAELERAAAQAVGETVPSRPREEPPTTNLQRPRFGSWSLEVGRSLFSGSVR